jgi:toxin ParE1/3/4
MKFRLAAAASADIEHIAQWIAQDSPIRALAFAEDLYQKCRELAEYPTLHPIIDRHKAHGIRRRIYGSYLLYYQILDELIIVRIVHGARNQSDIFG